MLRIKIKDLPKDEDINRDEMKCIVGGLGLSSYNLNTTPYTRMQWNAPKLKFLRVLDTTSQDIPVQLREYEIQ